ncbi:MAG: protoheme IX farnesyltransferase [Deltaproteobacteria bacterium CG11_big_fil_rev_8_21_14_0_20_47_16]|nr:MAG: protoheme IX farnesyltransferase [Deltaproteobacteria bacterium CG11_big_fil_rev_8_21_14_0_20_47_16]
MASVGIKTQLRAYWQLTKPNITILFVITGLTALIVQGTPIFTPQSALILFAIFCTGASANAFNQYLERALDAQMERTRKKRPIPLGHIKPNHALAFVVIGGTVGILILGLMSNVLAAFLALTVILFYGFIYTLWLKPRTPYNIVIGGVPGAMAPLIAWAAVTDTLSPAACLMFGMVFMWTPPHFWALAIYIKDEYAGVSVPMLPVVKGVKHTYDQILLYTVILIPMSLLFAWPLGVAGIPYVIMAGILGAFYLKKTLHMIKTKDPKDAYKTFFFSIAYLFGIFVALMIDQLI